MFSSSDIRDAGNEAREACIPIRSSLLLCLSSCSLLSISLCWLLVIGIFCYATKRLFESFSTFQKIGTSKRGGHSTSCSGVQTFPDLRFKMFSDDYGPIVKKVKNIFFTVSVIIKAYIK